MATERETWTRNRLEGLAGTTETLRLEFKSSKALIWDEGGERKRQLVKAAALGQPLVDPSP